MTELISLGSILLKPFDPDSMNFLIWLNQLEYIVDYMHIKNNMKVTFLLSLINTVAHSQILRKVAPANPRDLPYEVLISHLEQSYGVYQGEWAANYRFVNRIQFLGESFLQYVNALMKILSKASIFLKNDGNLTVRLMNGIRNNQMKTILRNCSNLPLSRAIVIVAQFELQKILTSPY